MGERGWNTMYYSPLLNKPSLLSHLAQLVYPQRHPTMSSRTTAIIDNPIELQSGTGMYACMVRATNECTIYPQRSDLCYM